MPAELTRKQFLAGVLAATASPKAAAKALQASPQAADITLDDLKAAEKLAGLTFTDEQRQQILGSVKGSRRTYDALRSQNLEYRIEPPTEFRPITPPPPGKIQAKPTGRTPDKPTKDDDIAFLTTRELGLLIKSKRISSTELTKIYIARMKAYGDKLLCLVTLLEERAMKAAKRADEEIASGRYRGPLHGIPCGIKDLFALKGAPTTWGSEPHKNQVFDYDSAVVARLDAAGAIIIAKLSLGALAQGDVWFKGRTQNPWNPVQGSSGSSAGSACAAAAGLVGFAIGTETMGSIMSPSHQCRVTGLRPTYGRISRAGAMAVSWTMDKIGPICRHAEDCALVMASIAGHDPLDPTSADAAFEWPYRGDLGKLRVGFLVGENENPAERLRDPHLVQLAQLGVKLASFTPRAMPPGVNLILGVEAAAAFDDFTRGDTIGELKDSAWPQTYRSNRYVPAVEYLRAQRARTLLMRQFEEDFGQLDMLVATGIGGSLLGITNYTGHPQLLVPLEPSANDSPRSISFVGRPYREDAMLALAAAFQNASGTYRRRPSLAG
jgi:Asp-tRNA(Asn)/Glu-tRNA(Gln) amidotransferase A subunit family amidase